MDAFHTFVKRRMQAYKDMVAHNTNRGAPKGHPLELSKNHGKEVQDHFKSQSPEMQGKILHHKRNYESSDMHIDKAYWLAADAAMKASQKKK